MADPPSTPAGPDDLIPTDDDASIEVGVPELAWSQAWQIPVLMLGFGMLVVGIYFALPRYEEPDYPGVLSDIEVRLKEEELELAELKLKQLNSDLLFMEASSDELEAHMWQLFGDLAFRQIDKYVWRGVTTDVGRENLQKIKGFYHKSEKMGRSLPPQALRRYAQTLAALGQDEQALEMIGKMPEGMDPPRYQMVRDLIERRIQADPGATSKDVARLLVRFEDELAKETNPIVKRGHQIWALAIKAERHLKAGDPDGVVKLLVEGGLVGLIERGATERDLVPLTVRLGEAYAKQGKFESARLNLRRAQQHLPSGHVLGPRIHVAFGDITHAERFGGSYEQAYIHYRQAYDLDKAGPSSIDALIGLGHTEANRDGRFPEALDWFKLAVKRVIEAEVSPRDDRRQRLGHYIRDVHVVREYERGEYRRALALLKVYEPLEAPNLAAETLQALASVNERLGEQALAMVESLRPSLADPGVAPNLQARQLHNEEAAIAFERAGEYYRRQAGELTHTTDEHGDALWKSAKNFEKAQRWGLAFEVYSDYLQTSDRADRREEASFRIAQALLAKQQPEAAVQRMRAIIEDAPAGEWAKRSYVPMAEGLAQLERWGEAEALLRSVTENHPAIGPESPYYHDALIELGRLMYRRGAQNPVYYARAIEVLGDAGGAVDRYQRDSRFKDKMPMLRYMLADSLRLSAQGLVEQAELARTETERMAMLTARLERLADAQMYYNQVVVELETWHADAFSEIEFQYFRNAQFYQADCAFERGDYETAIGQYLNAVSRWQDHPAALVGWVQIMNARAELGQFEAARSAHARAMELFNQMPEGAFARADSLMTRERWDAWLQWMQQLDLFTSNVDASAGD